MWQVTSSEQKYANRWIVVREDTVVRPDGTPGTYGVVTVRNDSVFVVAMTEDDRVWLITVDRHTVGPSVEVPAGGTDGEDPLVAAQRELAEETGLVAGRWERVGSMAALNGICEAPEHVFLATDLSPAGDNRDEQRLEGISGVRAVPWDEVLQMVRDGRITDGETVAALMFAALRLGRVA